MTPQGMPPEQKDKITLAYIDVVTAKPPVRRFRPVDAHADTLPADGKAATPPPTKKK